MHTGEPLFGGTNQVDQVCRIIDIIGPPPVEMIRNSPDKNRTNVSPTAFSVQKMVYYLRHTDSFLQFFEKINVGEDHRLPSTCDLSCTIRDNLDGSSYVLKRPGKDNPPSRTLEEVIGVYTSGPGGRRSGEPGHTVAKYEEFLDFVR
jgi:dual specificity tyrosine-phosphorylation-regulated kinase 1